MSSFLEDVEELFGESDFYNILKIARSANKNEIRKAYYQLSLKVHPDRVAKDELQHATKKFQVLGKIYEVLTSDELRTVYDETGTVGDECSAANDDRNWYEYWRLLFARVTTDDIEKFQEMYKGSDEELEDLKKAYLDAKGDMDQIIDNMMCATVEDDEDRFRQIIIDWIRNKVVKSFRVFTKEDQKKQYNRKRKASAEALEAQKELNKLVKNGKSSDLAALIQRNQQSRADRADNFFAMMEEKYGGKSRGSSASTSRQSPSKSTHDTSSRSPRKKGTGNSKKSSTKSKKPPKSSSSSPLKKGEVKRSPRKSPKKKAWTGESSRKSQQKSPSKPKNMS